MSTGAPGERMAAEWRGNRRLRLGVLAVLAILGLQMVLYMSDARVARIEQYERDARLLGRLEEASGEAAWPQRATDVAAALDKLRSTMPVASSEGLAQAELQAWLGDLAVFAGIGNPAVRVEPALAVDGQPELWQVLARLDGDMSESQSRLLMRTLAAALPWYRTERLQVQGGATPRVSLVIRGYFRKGDGKQSGASRPAGLPSAAVARSSGAAAPPIRRNPLATADAVSAPVPAPSAGNRTPRPPANPLAAPAGQSPANQPSTPAPRRRNPLAPPDAVASPAPGGPEQSRSGMQAAAGKAPPPPSPRSRR